MYLLGDIHGNFNEISYFAQKNIEKEPTTLIQVGDFGAGFHSDFLDDMEQLNTTLNEFNVTLYAIRGNHDDPKFFDGTYNWSNIKLLPDYTVMVIEGKRILFIGGATSIDRLQRTPGKTWWDGEVFNLDVDKLSQFEGIDVVVTHTAPKFAFPIGFNSLVMSFAAYDSTLIENLTNERNAVGIVHETLKEKNKIKKWFYGHFHTTETTRYEDTDFHVLGINYIYQL
jgi:UDP-2,3-diacylglucosamine pyrophosphatase LpxH